MKVLSVDYGDARTGLACCDKTGTLAYPVGVIRERDMQLTARKCAEQAGKEGAEHIIVGYPRNMDGTEGERCRLCAEFARKLYETGGIPVELWDERVTTVQAHSYLTASGVRGRQRKNVVDAVAAVILLEGYLLYCRNTGIKPGENHPRQMLAESPEDDGTEKNI